jgi:Ca2+-transporting ATPase
MLGLSETEAQVALKTWGYNELPSAKDKSVLDIAKAVIREPMFLLLIGCGALYMVLGDYKEGIVLSLAIFLIIGITFFQYKKTTRALELLKKIASPGVFVIRDDREIRIAAREVVPGDLLVLKEGDRVAADATLFIPQIRRGPLLFPPFSWATFY